MTVQVMAREPMLAHVKSVNPETGEIVVSLDAEEREITLPMSRGTDTQALKPGSLVRVWPSEQATLSGMNSSPRITPVHQGSLLNDRTGVRGRLRRIGGGGGRMGGGRGGR